MAANLGRRLVSSIRSQGLAQWSSGAPRELTKMRPVLAATWSVRFSPKALHSGLAQLNGLADAGTGKAGLGVQTIDCKQGRQGRAGRAGRAFGMLINRLSGA